MRFHEVLHDGQAQSEAALNPGRRTVRLTERLEDRRQKVRRNPFAGIGDLQFDIRIDLPQPEMERAAARRELDGVRQQVRNHLLEA